MCDICVDTEKSKRSILLLYHTCVYIYKQYIFICIDIYIFKIIYINNVESIC